MISAQDGRWGTIATNFETFFGAEGAFLENFWDFSKVENQKRGFETFLES